MTTHKIQTATSSAALMITCAHVSTPSTPDRIPAAITNGMIRRMSASVAWRSATRPLFVRGAERVEHPVEQCALAGDVQAAIADTELVQLLGATNSRPAVSGREVVEQQELRMPST